MSNITEIRVDAPKVLKRLFFGLLIAELAIVLADVLFFRKGFFFGADIGYMFNMSLEASISNWFSSTQTFVIALVLLAIAFLSVHRKMSKRHIWSWGILSFIFFFISADDGSAIHERFGDAFASAAISSTGLVRSIAESFPTYYWYIIMAPILLFVLLFIIWFIKNELRNDRHRYALYFGLLIFSFTILLDFVEGTNVGIFQSDVLSHDVQVLEEFLEMFANTIFLITFLQILMERIEGVSLRFVHNVTQSNDRT